MGYYTYNGGLIGTGQITASQGVHDLRRNIITPPGALYSFSSFTFTNGSTEGQNGPTQANLLASYNTVLYTWLNNSDFFTQGEYQGFQKWTVPRTGNYEFVVIGASGGQKVHPSYQAGNYQPMAAVVTATYSLTKGDKIQLIVGQRGEDDGTYFYNGSASEFDNSAPGGGGGSFVFFNSSDAEPLIAAGGAGGGSRNSGTEMDASLTTDGKNSQSTTNSTNYGTGGYGSRPLTGGSSYWSAGGAGWKSDGTGGNQATSYNYLAGLQGAAAGRNPANGALGGTRWNDGIDSGGDGGFGGGGGGGSDNIGTGGGGGYSGGGGSNNTPNNAGGGGGGSYSNSTNRVGSATITQHNIWAHGSIQITAL